MEDSTKSAERIRRAGGKEVQEYGEGDITEDVPWPDMDSFWPSEANKVQVQSFVRQHIAERILLDYNVIVSGAITDCDNLPAEKFETGRTRVAVIEYLKAPIEEADDRIVHHCAYEVNHGCKRILTISNDADTVARLLHFMKTFKDHGLTHLWCLYGVGENRRYIPLHKVHGV